MKRIVAAVSMLTRLCVVWPALGADTPTVVDLARTTKHAWR